MPIIAGFWYPWSIGFQPWLFQWIRISITILLATMIGWKIRYYDYSAIEVNRIQIWLENQWRTVLNCKFIWNHFPNLQKSDWQSREVQWWNRGEEGKVEGRRENGRRGGGREEEGRGQGKWVREGKDEKGRRRMRSRRRGRKKTRRMRKRRREGWEWEKQKRKQEEEKDKKENRIRRRR